MQWSKQETDQVDATFAALCELYQKSLSEALYAIYMRVLEKYPANLVVSALDKAIATLKFFPKPSELEDLIHGNPEEQAMKAWMSLIEAISSVGHFSNVLFEDPKLCAVIKFMGGWPAVCSWPTKYMDIKRDEFISSYKNMKNPPPSTMLIGTGDVLSISSPHPSLFGWAIVDQGGEIHKMRRVLADNGVDVLDLPESPPRPLLQAPEEEEADTELIPVSSFVPKLLGVLSGNAVDGGNGRGASEKNGDAPGRKGEESGAAKRAANSSKRQPGKAVRSQLQEARKGNEQDGDEVFDIS